MKVQIKPELNNESKARFFAQYWGQKVWIVPVNGESFVQKVCASYMTKYSLKHRALLLTPISDITDEDLEILLPIVQSTSYYGSHLRANMVKQIFNEYLTKGSSIHGLQWWYLLDTLRSLGYAIPWMGHSVQDLVNARWVKLKGVNTNG